MSERIEQMAYDIEVMELTPAHHIESIPVREMFRGEVVWEGVVEVFDLKGHPETKRCYAWYTLSKNGDIDDLAIILQKPPVTDPITAVRAYVASLGRK